MTTALGRTRALLNTPPTPPVPGQLDLQEHTVTEQPDTERNGQPLVHHQPSLWSL
ncbi:hypothetical protein RKD45_002478 [Streptomyces griseus]